MLIANDDIESEDTLLAIGQQINIALIDPVLTLIYEELITYDMEEQYEKTTEEDPTKYVGYSKLKQPGINGIKRVTSSVQFINGEQNQGAYFIGEGQVIRPTQNEITIKGTKRRTEGNGGIYVDNNQPWAWPTNSPYIITSPYGYRWGTLHDGMDISGTGYGSPIYAALDGEVLYSGWNGYLGRAAGLNIVVCHTNGYCTAYAHLSKTYVKAGDRVSRRQKIGAMGDTGNVTGTHLHFGVFTGIPYNGGRPFDPRKLWQ